MSARKKHDAEHLLSDGLDLIDGLHGTLIELAQAAGVKHDDEALTSDDGRDYPRTQFVVEGNDKPKRGECSLDTRLSLCLTFEQAEVLMAELARSLREEDREIEIELDGRLHILRDTRRELELALRAED